MEASKIICKKCVGYAIPIYKSNGIHIGEYCSLCGGWNRWVPKEEAMKYKIEDDPKNEPLF
jgi:hypothetical protein